MMMEHFVKMDLKIERFHEETAIWKEEMLQKMEDWKDELKHHFDIVTENIRHDLLYGAISDKVQQHEDRIVVLEARRTR